MNPPVASPPTATDLSQVADRAQQETLELLEWHRVCDHLSGFASTGMGRDAARVQPLPASLDESKQRLAETVEMAVLDDLTDCLLYTSPSPRDSVVSRMPSSA